MYQRHPPDYSQAMMDAAKAIGFVSVGAKAIDEQLQDSLITGSNEEQAEQRRFQLCNKRDSLSEIEGKAAQLLQEIKAAELSARRDEVSDEFSVVHAEELDIVRMESSQLAQQNRHFEFEREEIAQDRNRTILEHLNEGNWTERTGTGRGGGHKFYTRMVCLVETPFQPEKQTFTMASTPSDYRAGKNALQQLRKLDENVVDIPDETAEVSSGDDMIASQKEIIFKAKMKNIAKLHTEKDRIATELASENAAVRHLWN